MKIIDRKTFLALPAGVVFSKYVPCVFDVLQIKGDSIGAIDFFAISLADAIDGNSSNEIFDALDASQMDGTSVNFDFETETRDGCFDEEQLFAVWEPADVASLVARLQKLLPADVTYPWRPISTAPRDGTLIDLWVQGKRCPGCFWCEGFEPEDGHWHQQYAEQPTATFDVYGGPTHWMPLPDPPSDPAAPSSPA